MGKNGSKFYKVDSQHVDIRYFSVKYRVEKGEFEIEYCLNKTMLECFHQATSNNPLQEVHILILG